MVSGQTPMDVQRGNYGFLVILVDMAAKICCKDVGWF